MVARVTRPLGTNSEFMRQVKRKSAEIVRKDLQLVADDAARRADAMVGKLYDNHREPERRRSGRHLQGSFYGQVLNTSLPLTVVLRSRAPGVKVNALNFGSAAHEIAARNAPLLSFPGTRVAWVRKEKVQHPGTKGDHFMERSLEAAIRQRYKRAIAVRVISH